MVSERFQNYKMGEYGILERMKMSPQAWEVFAELLVNFAGVILLAIPGYFIAQDWFRLTTCISFVC